MLFLLCLLPQNSAGMFWSSYLLYFIWMLSGRAGTSLFGTASHGQSAASAASAQSQGRTVFTQFLFSIMRDT